MANLGQPSDEIIGYELVANYRGSQVRLENGDVPTSYAVTLDDLDPAISNIQAVLVRPDAPLPFVFQMEQSGISYWQELPIQLEGNKTVNIPLTVNFGYDVDALRLESPVHDDPRSGRYSLGYLEGIASIVLEVVFRLASGQSVAGPRSECWYAAAR